MAKRRFSYPTSEDSASGAKLWRNLAILVAPSRFNSENVELLGFPPPLSLPGGFVKYDPRFEVCSDLVMNFLYLSDIHFSLPLPMSDFDRHARTRLACLKACEKFIMENGRIDYVLITGDAAATGQELEYM